MEHNEIIKALECCASGNCISGNCPLCDLANDFDMLGCTSKLATNTLALFNSQEQKIFELENRLKECENGYEGTLYLERCKLHDAEQKIKELTEENEKLIADCVKGAVALIKEMLRSRAIKADTVRKMQERLKAKAYTNNYCQDVVLLSNIDQIAKELTDDIQ